MSGTTALRTLVLSCHPLPSLAVTSFAVVLAIGDDRPVSVTALVAAVVLAGQLSIGWGNDLLDRRRDERAGRVDKPLAAGGDARIVRAACVVATTVAVALAPLLGGAAAVASLVVLGGGWAYNLGLKATIWSWAPYLVAFAALPSVALAGDGGAVAPTWLAGCAGVLGVGAHFLNGAPDVDDDRAAEVHGAPARIGAWPSVGVGLLLIGGATVTAASASEVAPPASWVLVVTGAVAALVGLALIGASRRADRASAPVPRAVFPAALGLIAVVVVVLVLAV